MNVLVCCEESQRVTIELRKRGFNAFSCDLMECSGGHPEWHIQANCLPLLRSCVTFYTNDLKIHFIEKWDAIVAFPPCRYLADSGSRFCEGISQYASERRVLRFNAMEFFSTILKAPCDLVIVENSFSTYINENLREPDCMIQPYLIGDPYYKRTCLWFNRKLQFPYDLPVITGTFPNWATMPHYDRYGKKLQFGSEELRIARAKTFPGVARFLADLVEFNYFKSNDCYSCYLSKEN